MLLVARRRLESDLQNVWEASVRRERSPRTSWMAAGGGGGGGSLMRMNSVGSRLQLSGSFDGQPIVAPLGLALDASTASFRGGGGRSVSPGGGSSGSGSPTRASALFARDALADHRDGNPGLHWSRSMSPSGGQHQSRAATSASASAGLQAPSATSAPKSSAAATSPNGTLVSSLPPIPKRSTSPVAPGDRSAGAAAQLEPPPVSSK